jgi:hypothetical protein
MTITYRDTKGSALTYGELDENFRDLLEDTTLQRVLNNDNVSNSTITVTGVTTNSIVISTPTIPSTNSSAGEKGQIAYDSGFVYVCVANNTWRRAALTSW